MFWLSFSLDSKAATPNCLSLHSPAHQIGISAFRISKMPNIIVKKIPKNVKPHSYLIKNKIMEPLTPLTAVRKP